MWIICVIYVLCLPCFRVCSLLPWERSNLLAIVCDVYCGFATFPFGQVWYLIVSIADPTVFPSFIS